MKRKLKRAAVLLILFIAVTNLLYSALTALPMMLPLVIPRHITEHLPREGRMFFSTIPHCSANCAYCITIVAEPPMHHSITDEGIHLFGTGNRALDGLGVFMFAFLCQVNSFEVYWDMSDRSASRFTLCSAIAMLLCFIVYGSTAVFATLTSQSCDRFRSTPVQPSQGAGGDGGIHWFVGEALRLLPAHLHGHPQLPVPQCWVGPRQAGILEALRRRRQSCVAALLFGLFIPSINMVFGFIGSFCGGATGFLLPSIFMMYGGNWSLRSVGWAHYTITYALLFAGVIMVVFGTGATIYGVVAGD
ncbi:amino acid transporter [Trypanosoma cruzi]|nr:amino acid transporter [Trypanosoma cruzi]